MDNKITSGNTGLRVDIDASRTRQAPKTDFGTMVGTGLSRTADAVMGAGQLAAPFIPGGAILSAAITGVGQLKSSAAGQGGPSAMGANSTSLGINTGTQEGGGGLTSAMGGQGTTPTGNDPKALIDYNMSQNMYYLALQQEIQTENRKFTTISNVMKTRHDTQKNAINNVR